MSMMISSSNTCRRHMARPNDVQRCAHLPAPPKSRPAGRARDHHAVAGRLMEAATFADPVQAPCACRGCFWYCSFTDTVCCSSEQYAMLWIGRGCGHLLMGQPAAAKHVIPCEWPSSLRAFGCKAAAGETPSAPCTLLHDLQGCGGHYGLSGRSRHNGRPASC